MKNKKIEDGNFWEKKDQFCIGFLTEFTQQ